MHIDNVIFLILSKNAYTKFSARPQFFSNCRTDGRGVCFMRSGCRTSAVRLSFRIGVRTGGPIAQFQRRNCSILPVEVISLSGVRSFGICSAMDICRNSGSTHGYCDLAGALHCRNRRYFCKLRFLLSRCHGKQSFLPFIIRLATHSLFFTPCQHTQPTVSALRDSLCPQRQLILLIQSLQISCHNRVSRRVYATRVYSPLLYGGILSYYSVFSKSPLDLTLTLHS